jgi:hypothetical protein
MTDIEKDATEDLAHVKGVIASVGSDVGVVKAWYKNHLFYAGMAAGAVVALLVRHFA